MAVDAIARCMSDSRHLFLSQTLHPLWQSALKAFPEPKRASQPTIVLKRVLSDIAPGGGGANGNDSESQKLSSATVFSKSFRQSTFGQMFTQLSKLPNGVFFRSGQVWKVTLAGFNSIDAGGPYVRKMGIFALQTCATITL